MRRTRAPLRSTMSASSAISIGALSPIGEPLATLPPIVPALRIGTDAKRSHMSGSAGCRLTSALQASSSDAPAPIDKRAVARGVDALQLVDVADVDQLGQVAELLVDPQADVGRAGEHARLRVLLDQRRERIERARRVERCSGAGAALRAARSVHAA